MSIMRVAATTAGSPPYAGERPEVISCEDKDANAKIAASDIPRSARMCAVRKMSEGASVKRLRVEVMACQPTTELLFRQPVGRVSGGGIIPESRGSFVGSASGCGSRRTRSRGSRRSVGGSYLDKQRFGLYGSTDPGSESCAWWPQKRPRAEFKIIGFV
jgi:hypothetical protein